MSSRPTLPCRCYTVASDTRALTSKTIIAQTHQHPHHTSLENVKMYQELDPARDGTHKYCSTTMAILPTSILYTFA